MTVADPLVDFLQDSPDLGRVDASKVWESVFAFIEYSVNNVIPYYLEFCPSGLIFLGQQGPYSKVRQDGIHPDGPYIDGVDAYALRLVDTGIGKILYSNSLEIRL